MQRIQIPEGDPQPAQVDLAVDAIVAGKMVVLPTETVYGLAVDPRRPPAVQRLVKLKVRAPEQRFTHHLHDISQVDDLAKAPRPRVRTFLEQRTSATYAPRMAPSESGSPPRTSPAP